MVVVLLLGGDRRAPAVYTGALPGLVRAPPIQFAAERWYAGGVRSHPADVLRGGAVWTGDQAVEAHGDGACHLYGRVAVNSHGRVGRSDGAVLPVMCVGRWQCLDGLETVLVVCRGGWQ